jgi:hypothetical protein
MRTPGSLGVLATVAAVLGFCAAADAVVNIQNVGAGARSAALGNSFVAVADDGDAVFYNPAGVAQMEGRQVAYTNVSLLFQGIEGDDLGQHVASYVMPLGTKLGMGLGYERIGSDLMSENGAFLSLGYRATSALSLGVNAKYLFWSVGDIPADATTGAEDPLSNSSAGAIGVDVGVLWKTPFWGVQLGAMAKNVNKPNVAKTDVPGDSDAGALPMDVSVGASYRIGGVSLVTVEWAGRDVGGDELDSRLVVGGETELLQGLQLRAGGSKLFQEDASGDVNAGLGYSFNSVHFDYGYHIPLDLTETDGAHRFSFAYRF